MRIAELYKGLGKLVNIHAQVLDRAKALTQ
jgi:hypothetical protein